MSTHPSGGDPAAAATTAHDGASLPRAVLAARTAAERLDLLGWDALCAVCRAHTGRFRPTARGAVEPRDGFPIVYSEARAARMALPDDVCVVCEDRTCPAVDVCALAHGDAAWLTPNLYPIVFPWDETHEADDAAARDSLGVHLVQWSTRHHAAGWAGADDAMSAALVAQLARAEGFLLHHADARFPPSGPEHRGHIALVKNRGRRVGGSVAHDHQQILLSARAPSEPPRTAGLVRRLLDETPAALRVERVHGRVTSLVPPFMRRPLHAFVLPDDGASDAHGAGWLHHLDDVTLRALAVAVGRLLAAADHCMRDAPGGPAWNLVCHTGAGLTPLFELRPFTQPLGGFEHLGLYLCEERPETSAARLRAALPGSSN